MVKGFFIAAVLLFHAIQANAQNETDIETWSKSSMSKHMHSKVLVVAPTGKSGYPNIKNFKKNEFFAMLGMEQPSVENTRMFFLVNELKPASTIEAAKILSVDYAFETEKSGTTITHIASGKSVLLPPTKNAEEINTHLRKSFGYDGYVVDSKDGLLLVKYANSAIDVGGQAVILDSQEPFLTPNAQVNGTFLVEMIEKAGDYGVFRVVIGDGDKKIPVYAKIQFSSR